MSIEDNRNYVCGFCGSEINEKEGERCKDLKRRRGYFRARVTDISTDKRGYAGHSDIVTFLLIDSGKVVKRSLSLYPEEERLERGQQGGVVFYDSIAPIEWTGHYCWDVWREAIIGKELVVELGLYGPFTAPFRVMAFYPIEAWEG